MIQHTKKQILVQFSSGDVLSVNVVIPVTDNE